jgi:hypothetical protein
MNLFYHITFIFISNELRSKRKQILINNEKKKGLDIEDRDHLFVSFYEITKD